MLNDNNMEGTINVNLAKILILLLFLGSPPNGTVTQNNSHGPPKQQVTHTFPSN